MKDKVATLLLIILCIIAINHISHEDQNKDIFNDWQNTYQITFQSKAQEFYRRQIFVKKLKQIQEHNLNKQNSYKMGINQFMIYTEQQFVQKFLNTRLSKYHVLQPISYIQATQDNAVIIDWSAKGAVGPVRNQGQCGNAVLYATLGVVQGLTKIQTGNLQILSAQQLIDCSYGCNGGIISTGYTFYKTYGACTQKQYPSTGKQGTCQHKNCTFKISGASTANTCQVLKSAIKLQPVAVTVDASKWSTYASGIFSNCGTQLNHMVVLTALADQYWRCKNSWGTSWGEQGYIRLAPGNTCGICISSSWPIA